MDIEQREILNVVPWELSAYSLRGASYTGGTETNHAGINIQMSVVGYASRIHRLSNADLRWLAEDVVKPAMDWAEVPNQWTRAYGPNEGIVLASTKSPIRMSNRAWENFSGVSYHQQVPGQDHWDMGALSWQQCMAYAGAMTPTPLPNDDETAQQIPGMTSPLMIGSTGSAVAKLQKLLNTYFNNDLEVDGVFGAATKQAVQEVEAILNIKTDGVWGPKTAGQYETWYDELANAVVLGLKAEGLTADEKVAVKELRQLGRKGLVALQASEELERMITSAYSALGVQDSASETGMLDAVRLISQKLRGIEGDRAKALAAIK